MACVLRISGANLDVEALLGLIPLEAYKVFYKDNYRNAVTESDGRNLMSGCNISASEAGMSNLGDQIAETLAFILANYNALRGIREFPGVDFVLFDFAADLHPPGFSSFRFPRELLRMLGTLGIDLELSVYPTAGICGDET